jgi:hypothetical protein
MQAGELEMKRAIAAAVALAAALSWTALAEDKVVREKDRTVYRKRSVVDFSDVSVEGELTKPQGSYVLDRQKSGFPSRIKLRASFQPELQKSVDNL